MLKRIASTGVNLVVLGVSVGIFLVAFIAGMARNGDPTGWGSVTLVSTGA
jgi:hypothetical protein